MSHQVVINYEAISIECRSICEVAEKQLCKINSIIRKIDETSTTLQGSETEGMKRALNEQAAIIKTRIDELIKESKRVGKQGKVVTDSDYLRGNERKIIQVARDLSKEVNKFTTTEIANYEALLDNLLQRKISENNKDIQNRAAGNVLYNEEFYKALSNEKDEVLKGYLYLEWLDNKNTGKSFSELKKLAQGKMKNSIDNYYQKEQKKLITELETEMREAKLDEETIATVLKTESSDIVTQISKMRDMATEKIVSETVRKNTIKIVMECIENKGFIVDRNNIKLQKDKDEVVLLAQKASGQWAEFRVMLDGKFIYRFDGYEGQACQEDIRPFMSDLEEIYGIKVTDSKEIWRNPDKISTQKYQQQNFKSNKE